MRSYPVSLVSFFLCVITNFVNQLEADNTQESIVYQPSSQPTASFVAPSVPEDLLGEPLLSSPPTNMMTNDIVDARLSSQYSSVLNSSIHLFYLLLFVMLLICAVAYKRWVIFVSSESCTLFIKLPIWRLHWSMYGYVSFDIPTNFSPPQYHAMYRYFGLRERDTSTRYTKVAAEDPDQKRDTAGTSLSWANHAGPPNKNAYQYNWLAMRTVQL